MEYILSCGKCGKGFTNYKGNLGNLTRHYIKHKRR